jgi:hypothetical protein
VTRPTWLAALLAFGACSTQHQNGGPCSGTKDCVAPLQCLTIFPGGYCTADCSTAACPAGELCSAVLGAQVCLKGCTGAADCRSGYQCFQGACQPACGSDSDCGKGFSCQGGTCMVRPGAPVGADCLADDDCSSQLCNLRKCATPCDHDNLCGATQTCSLNAIGDGVASPTTHISPICIARRGTAAPGAACKADADCDRGACQLGLCVELCKVTGDCHGQAMTCAGMTAVLDGYVTAPFSGCLPTRANIDFDGTRLVVPLPTTAQSFAIDVRADPFDFTNLVGVFALTDPHGVQVYTPPQQPGDFYNINLRYVPTEGGSTMLVPNAPRVPITPGMYKFDGNTTNGGTLVSRVYMKLSDGPITGGNVALNFYVTDLSLACRSLSLSDLQNGGAIDQAIGQMKRIFMQANIAITSVNWFDVTSAQINTIKVNTTNGGMELPDLDNLLLAVTGLHGTKAGLDVVLLRSITDPNGGQSGVLGIAGGIPTSPLLGTAHSGVAVSLDTLCFLGQDTFGSTTAHELGHSMGLFHSIEMTGEHDPLTDTAGDGPNNLMYWEESSGAHLSTQQSGVIRNDPKVQP